MTCYDGTSTQDVGDSGHAKSKKLWSLTHSAFCSHLVMVKENPGRFRALAGPGAGASALLCFALLLAPGYALGGIKNILRARHQQIPPPAAILDGYLGTQSAAGQLSSAHPASTPCSSYPSARTCLQKHLSSAACLYMALALAPQEQSAWMVLLGTSQDM